MESLRINRLVSKGWSHSSASRCSHVLAQSTRDVYANLLNKLVEFCSLNNVAFPPSEATLADFLCYVASGSARPRSVLTNSLAAYSWYCHVSDFNSCLSIDISDLKHALIKTSSTAPRKKIKCVS